ncbi:MAG TPA: helix-hairpin-helix domain-containing protein [Tepidisphaeraceae bacterium]|jgi:hypothetical protein
MWNPSQRKIILLLVIGLGVYAAILYARGRTVIPDPLAGNGPRFAEVQDRIDPNEATWQHLAAIPELGEKRAKAIVTYRELIAKNHPGEKAFHHPADLLAVKGIGVAMMTRLQECLIFDELSPATAPAQRQ